MRLKGRQLTVLSGQAGIVRLPGSCRLCLWLAFVLLTVFACSRDENDSLRNLDDYFERLMPSVELENEAGRLLEQLERPTEAGTNEPVGRVLAEKYDLLWPAFVRYADQLSHVEPPAEVADLHRTYASAWLSLAAAFRDAVPEVREARSGSEVRQILTRRVGLPHLLLDDACLALDHFAAGHGIKAIIPCSELIPAV